MFNFHVISNAILFWVWFRGMGWYRGRLWPWVPIIFTIPISGLVFAHGSTSRYDCISYTHPRDAWLFISLLFDSNLLTHRIGLKLDFTHHKAWRMANAKEVSAQLKLWALLLDNILVLKVLFLPILNYLVAKQGCHEIQPSKLKDISRIVSWFSRMLQLGKMCVKFKDFKDIFKDVATLPSFKYTHTYTLVNS